MQILSKSRIRSGVGSNNLGGVIKGILFTRWQKKGS